MTKILTVSRKSHHPIETLFITEYDFVFNSMLLLINKYSMVVLDISQLQKVKETLTFLSAWIPHIYRYKSNKSTDLLFKSSARCCSICVGLENIVPSFRF